MRASIQSRTRSRTPVSIGSIQVSKSRASGCPVGCTECDLLIRSVMAWSPTGPERSNARIPLCGLHHPETTPPSKVYHLPDGTSQLLCKILFHIQVRTNSNHGRPIIGADVGFA